MATEIIRHLDWWIEEYFTRCSQGFIINETRLFVSPQGECMAKIEFIPSIPPGINISIKTDQYINQLKTVSFYNKKPLARDDEKKYIIKICGLSTDWYLLETISQYFFSSSDNLHLFFEFTFKTHDTLPQILGGHLMNPTFSDVTIRTSEGDELPAHKILLVARSGVFRAIFQHDTAEKATNFVECSFPTNVVKHLLAFTYQDTAADIEETVFDLLIAADYYQMDRLKERCAGVLKKKLDVDNAIEILTLADTHNACDLKKEALLFIANKKNAAKIVQTKGWNLLSHELSKYILEFILTQK